MRDYFEVPDGLDELKKDIPLTAALIARTARWVHPDTFHALPVWYPEIARGLPIYDSKWAHPRQNKNRISAAITEKLEPNIMAGKAFVAALGARKVPNWTVCHIWGVDDPAFQRSNSVIKDPRFYSCVGNMVWLPTPLKGYTDDVPEIKSMLRTCAFYLYGWVCEHDDVKEHAAQVRSGYIPQNYPESWPAPSRAVLPPNTAHFSDLVKSAIERRKTELRAMLKDQSLTNFPRLKVKEVLDFWKVQL